MLKRPIRIAIFLFFIFIITGLNGYTQKLISVHANNLPLNIILNKVSDENNIRFAFDDELFSKIETSFNFQKIELDQFLDIVCSNFGLKYRIIAGTYVFYVDNEKKMDDAIIETAKRNEINEEKPEEVVPASEFTFTGMIKNKKTGEKIKFGKVLINNSEETLTNEMGFFSKTFEKEDEINITISKMGYQSLDTTLVVDSSAYYVFSLVPVPKLEPMISLGFKPLNFFIEFPDVLELISFNPAFTLQVPSPEPNDLVNALTVLPGINYLKGIDTGLSIRGGAPSDNLVLLDGIPMIEISHLMGNLSALNSKFIQQAFVSRGGFGAEYGGRTSGIVDLTGKTGNSDETVIDFTANMLHTNIYVGVPITENSSLSGTFMKSFADVWSNYLINSFALENKTIKVNNGFMADASVDHTNMNYSNANAKLTIRPTDRNELSFNLFNSFDTQDRRYNFPGEGKYYQQNTNNSRSAGYSVNFKMQSTQGWLNTFTVGYHNMKSNDVSENGKTAAVKDQPVKPYFDSNIIHLRELTGGWKSELKQKYMSHKFGAGYNYNHLNYLYEDHEIKIAGANNFNDSISSQNQIESLNAYYQAELTPFKWLRLRLGARGFYNINKSLFSLQPRYGVELLPTPNLKIYYSSGRYLQHMYLTYRIDSYMNASPIWFIPEIKNQNLDAIHHIVGTRLENEKYLLNIEAYQKNNKGKIFFIGEKTFRGGLDVVGYTERIGEEMTQGVDFFFQYKAKVFKHLISYSFSNSMEKIEGVNNGKFFNSFDHQLHRLRITEIATYRGWTASINWYFANGMPYLLNHSTPNELSFGQLPNFMQLDISVVKQFDFNYFYADVGFTILNLLNHRNELSVKNITLPEGTNRHIVQTTTTATSFSPLFFINLRYE